MEHRTSSPEAVRHDDEKALPIARRLVKATRRGGHAPFPLLWRREYRVASVGGQRDMALWLQPVSSR